MSLSFLQSNVDIYTCWVKVIKIVKLPTVLWGTVHGLSYLSILTTIPPEEKSA